MALSVSGHWLISNLNSDICLSFILHLVSVLIDKWLTLYLVQIHNHGI